MDDFSGIEVKTHLKRLERGFEKYERSISALAKIIMAIRLSAGYYEAFEASATMLRHSLEEMGEAMQCLAVDFQGIIEKDKARE